MATEAKSGKIFGGTAVPAGSYVVNQAFVGEGKFTPKGQAERKYPTLEVELLHLKQDGTPGPVVLQTLKLNGIWRPRKDKDGNVVRHGGTFYDRLLEKFSGQSFEATAEAITTQCRGIIITIAYNEYVTEDGVGHVSKVDAGQKVGAMPALVPHVAPVQQPAPQPTATNQPTGQQQGDNGGLPF